ncbi:MAG: Abi family protein [Bacteroidales bacterium]
MVASDKTDYTKKPLTLVEQVARLKQRGLVFDDENEAIAYLFNISYYRLRAYTYPFQENGEESVHNFTRKDIHFKDIIDLYCFDRRLRSLVFNAIEKIEVAVRTKIVQVYAERTGDSHWYNDRCLFRFGYNDLLEQIKSDVNRSNEDFIKHYKSKYNEPPMPPSWMALEVVSFATLSRLFQALNLDGRKVCITEQFGLKKVAILENWLHAISNLRNCCAHHSRVWNRRFMVNVSLPYNTLYPFMDRTTMGQMHTNKLFAVLSCIVYILDIISPGCDFKTHIKDLLKSECLLFDLKDMGFPKCWQSLPVWLEK